MFLKRVKHYQQWLCSAIPLKTQVGPNKRPSSGRLYPVSAVKEHNRKGENVKSLTCFLYPSLTRDGGQ